MCLLVDDQGYEHGQPDPKDDTQVQRNWIPNHDKAIRVAKFNIGYNTALNSKTFSGENTRMGNYRQNISQKLKYDIATSINIGNGVYQMRERFQGPGQHRKIRTDVTMIKNKTFATR